MLSRSGSKRNESSTPRSNFSKKNGTSSDLKIKKDSNRVKVYVRVRPFSKDERQKKIPIVPFEISQDFTQLHIYADDRGHEKSYSFDHVFPMEDENKQVSETLTQPLVHSAMNGFNGTLMAYGQTGAGKTHSLMAEDGIAKTLIDKCFSQIYDDVKHNYKVTVSYLQIYQEKIFDLLSNNDLNNGKGDLAIRENPRTGIYVDNLSDYVVRSPAEVLQYISNGKKKLVFAETKMNRMSSRSHAVFQMVIERTRKNDIEEEDNDSSKVPVPTNGSETQEVSDDDGELDLDEYCKDVIIRGKIHICDLAGSERIKKTGASGDRLNEAQHINSSLLELGNVIQALADNSKKHVPFRNSILTRLLQESLGGNCKTSLIICVSPTTRDIQETKCTLNFGSRAMKVTNTAYVNMEVDFKSLSDQLIKQLQTKEDEVHDIRASIVEQIEKQRLQIHGEFETKMAIKLKDQKKEYQKEIKKLKANIKNLEQENLLKEQEIKEMEEAIFIMDDNSRQDRNFMLQMLNSEQQINRFSTLDTDQSADDDTRSCQRLSYLISVIQNTMKGYPKENLMIDEAINMLSTICLELEDAEHHQMKGSAGVNDIHEQIQNLASGVKKNASNYGKFVEDQDFYAVCTKLFLLNRIQQFKETLGKLEKLNTVRSKIKEVLDNQAKNSKEAMNEKDMVDGKRNGLSTGTQVNLPLRFNVGVQAGSSKKKRGTNAGTQADFSTSPGVNMGIQAGYYFNGYGNNAETQVDLSNPGVNMGIQAGYYFNGYGNHISTQSDFSSSGISVGVQSDSYTDESTDDSVDGLHYADACNQAGDDDLFIASSRAPVMQMLPLPEVNTKKSREIFQGFSSTLNRIEDLVRTERTTAWTPPFHLSSTNRSDSIANHRANSSLGFRIDDSITSKYPSSSAYGSFSGSSTRLSTDHMLDSMSMTRSYGSPMYISSKYDSRRAWGETMMNRYNSVDNLMFSDLKNGFRSSSNDLSAPLPLPPPPITTPAPVSSSTSITAPNSPLTPVKPHVKKEKVVKMEGKIKMLEGKVKEVQKENQEYVMLVQELANYLPKGDKFQEIKRKVNGKIADIIIAARKESVQVARVEPYLNDKQKNYKVKYDYTPDKSSTPNTKSKNGKVTYDVHVNVVRKNVTKKISSESPNFIQFSPIRDEPPESLHSENEYCNGENGYTKHSGKAEAEKAFNEKVVDDKGYSLKESSKLKGQRPKSWYGAPNTDDKNERESKYLSPDLGRINAEPYKSNEVTFSKRSSSSLTLPSWMRLKKKPNQNNSKKIIT